MSNAACNAACVKEIRTHHLCAQQAAELVLHSKRVGGLSRVAVRRAPSAANVVEECERDPTFRALLRHAQKHNVV